MEKSEEVVDRRVVLHFDLDAFYVSVERELNADLRDVPVAVSQYNPYGTLEEKAAHQVIKRLVLSPHKLDGNAPPDPDANGSLIAVSYEARAAGVKRNDRGLQAARKCNNLRIVQVPVKHGKADLTMYRSASKRVMDTLIESIQMETCQFLSSKDIQIRVPVEIASIDEVYVDVTEPAHEMARRISILNQSNNQEETSLRVGPTWVDCMKEASTCTTIGGVETLSDAAVAANALNKEDLRRGSHLQVVDSTNQILDEGSLAWWRRNATNWTEVETCLACGAFFASNARRAVGQAFNGIFTLSAGVSVNKTLSKLASGYKKPNRQTLINRNDSNGSLEKMFHPLPLGRIRGLGGNFGEQVNTLLSIETVGQLAQVPLTTLVSSNLFGDAKTARFLYDIARGICRDEVTPRTKPKSIACGKTFRGKLTIGSTDLIALKKWIGELCSELTERLSTDRQQNNRVGSTVIVGIQTNDQRGSTSKQCRAPRSLDRYSATAFQLLIQLIETVKSRIRANTNVSIEGLTVSVTGFVDFAAGSSSIMAAFERSSHVDGAMNSHSKIAGRKSSSEGRAYYSFKGNSSEKKPSAIDKWLTDRKVGGQSDQSSSARNESTANTKETSSGSKKQSNKCGTIASYLGEKRGRIPKEYGVIYNSTKRSKSVALPTMEEIDPLVLSELPEDLRAALMEDINHEQRNKKSAGIQHFFGP